MKKIQLDSKKTFRLLILLISYSILIFGITLFVLVYFLNGTIPGFVLALIFSGIALYLAPLYIFPTIIILKYHLHEKSNSLKLLLVSVCGLLMITSLLPTTTTSITIMEAEQQFNDLYGDDYRDLDTTNMLQEPLSMWRHINVIPDDSDIEIKLNVEYYDKGKDKFHFDYYAPKDADDELPTVIKLHGGAWFLGNKGPVFNVPLSKYLAAQGYAVFDVQYGLYDIDEAAGDADLELVADAFKVMVDINPEFKDKVLPDYKENYMIQDQVFNIGMFTKFLSNHTSKYHVDKDNIIIVGSSAGAHMAGVVGCGYYNPKFNGTFSDELNIKGIILYYPPTDIKKMKSAMDDGSLGGYPPLGKAFNKMIDDGKMSDSKLEDEYEKYSAAYLIRDEDVDIAPILLLHGSLDGLVPYQAQAVDFYKLTEKYDRDCIFLTFYNNGHAFDVVSTQTPGWQISTYYVERFIALEVD
ncbi:MAG: alpha/beta hydrolase fold domain-containing protein [Promethearchaeota archaeon]